MKKNKQKHSEEQAALNMKELEESWKTRQSRNAWRIATGMCGRRTRTHLQRFDTITTTRATLREWVERARLPGNKGGFGAEVVVFDDEVEK